MNMDDALRIIKTVRNYQREYDECPNVKMRETRKSYGQLKIALSQKSDSFWKNGGVKWMVCTLFTGEFAIGMIVMMFIAICSMVFGIDIPEVSEGGDAVAILIVMGSLCIVYLIFLIVWLKKILNKIKEIKAAKREVVQYKKEYNANHAIYKEQLMKERARIKSEFGVFVKQNAVPTWMLKVSEGFKITYKTSYYNHEYSLSFEKIVDIYNSKFGNLPLLKEIEPGWLIERKYVTDELIYLVEKFSHISSYSDLCKLYKTIIEVKNVFFSLLKIEMKALKTRVDDWETNELREQVAHERAVDMHDKLMGEIKATNELQEKANKLAEEMLALKQKEDYQRYLNGYTEKPWS